MDQSLQQYIKPELLVIIPVLNVLGSFIKRTKIPDWKIPFILGVVSILLSTLWVFSKSPVTGLRDVLYALFVGVTQGILTSGTSVYLNQLVKQGKEGNVTKKDT
ncbi:MAG TPA: phage holin family protein [Clostridia bacterium]|nr:phage holin family protein [Clostridia bacterium]